jgi:hypothetical protein
MFPAGAGYDGAVVTLLLRCSISNLIPGSTCSGKILSKGMWNSPESSGLSFICSMDTSLTGNNNNRLQ